MTRRRQWHPTPVLLPRKSHGWRSLVGCQWHPTPVLLPGKSHGRRSLVGCSPWGRWESDTTERVHFDFSLSCIGEGNGNPLQCSCVENPRNRGAWWAAVYGVAQSWTQLKRLSSSSSSSHVTRAYLQDSTGSCIFDLECLLCLETIQPALFLKHSCCWPSFQSPGPLRSSSQPPHLIWIKYFSV